MLDRYVIGAGYMSRVIAFLLSVLLTTVCRAGVLVVDDDGPADFRTIQAALDRAREADSIMVRPGHYAEDVNFPGTNIVLTSVEPADSGIVRDTVIEGIVQFHGSEDANCVLAGFKIDGAVIGYDWRTDPNGAQHTHATIRHCVLENIMSGCGGILRGCDGTISHCVVAHVGYMCRRMWPVPAIAECRGSFVNCTLVDAADGIEIRPGEVCTLTNCIVYYGTPLIVREGGTLNLSYCDIEGGREAIFDTGIVNWGPGNIDVAPCFAGRGDELTAGDYHLNSQAGRWDGESGRWVRDEGTSACIDAGAPQSDWTAELWPHGRRINLGAYGGTPEASMSLSALGSIVDLVPDGLVNARDLLVLTRKWLVKDTLLAADVNRDGVTSLRDFAVLARSWHADVGSVAVPFELTLGEEAAWHEDYKGYDPCLPGYHLVGDIASVSLKALTDKLPDRLILTIRTSPGMHPMLEDFTLTGANARLSGAPFNPNVGLTYFRRIECSDQWEAVPDVKTDGWLTFEITGDEVRVTFGPAALDLLRSECTISWIDWYR
jgi:hypothetical protein